MEDSKGGEITRVLSGVRFDKHQLADMREMFKHPGYIQYLRLLAGVKQEAIRGSLEDPSVRDLHTFLADQSWCVTIEKLKRKPIETETAIAAILTEEESRKDENKSDD